MEEVLRLKISDGCMVKPQESTPSGLLGLSRIDALPALRVKVPTLHVFRRGPGAASVIKAALSRALVHYYPLAGRLVESPPAPLQLACTGEGVWFMEATAACGLEAVGYLDDGEWGLCQQLLPQPPPAEDGLDPIVLVQVTQFACDGFVVGLAISHSVCDGLGASQFLTAVGEATRGLHSPTTPPAWCREMLPPPIPTASLDQTQGQLPTSPFLSSSDWLLERATIDVSPASIARLKHRFMEASRRTCSTFEALAATLWRCRSQAIAHSGHLRGGENSTMIFLSDVRKLVEPPLPQGFYGNCIFPVVVSMPWSCAGGATLEEYIRLIQEAKALLPGRFAEWVSASKDGEGRGGKMEDPLAIPLSYEVLILSDWRRLALEELDLGCGRQMRLLVVPINTGAVPVCVVGRSTVPCDSGATRLVTWCVEKPEISVLRELMESELS